MELGSTPIDTSTPHPARRYNYWLGGKDNFAADRESGDQIAAAQPSVRLWALENRGFLRRAVGYLAREAGIRQFLDIGTGLPTADNTHEVAQRIAPASRVVYVDNDPLVMVHARALLTSTPEGRTSYLEADLRRPQDILTNDDLTQVLDLTQPVALMLIAVVHFVKDDDTEAGAHRLVRELVKALPSGSYLAMSHVTDDFLSESERIQIAQLGRKTPYQLRTRDQFGEFFAGLDLVDPGVTVISDWRPRGPRPDPTDIGCYGAVGRVP